MSVIVTLTVIREFWEEATGRNLIGLGNRESQVPLGSTSLQYRALEQHTLRDVCTFMFITPLFTIVLIWNQPRYSSENRNNASNRVSFIHKEEWD